MSTDASMSLTSRVASIWLINLNWGTISRMLWYNPSEWTLPQCDERLQGKPTWEW